MNTASRAHIAFRAWLALCLPCSISTSTDAYYNARPCSGCMPAVTSPVLEQTRGAQGDNPTPAVSIPPSRAFGYLLGDTLEQRIQLSGPDGAVALSTLPPDGRIDTWLARWPAALEQDQHGVTWLVLTYQIVNSPETTLEANLPALQLETEAGLTLSVPAWSYSLGPLTPARNTTRNSATTPGNTNTSDAMATDQELAAPLPDQAAGLRDVESPRWHLLQALAALLATLAAWAGWWFWRTRRDATRLPFAGAWQALVRLDSARRDEAPEAWREVHRAFNRLAGHTAGVASVPALLRETPWLQPFNDRIQAFFEASAARFFEQPPRLIDFELTRLCRDLQRAERRQSIQRPPPAS